MQKKDFVLDITHIGESFVAQLLRTPEGQKRFITLCKEHKLEILYEMSFVDYNVPIMVDRKKGDDKSEIDIVLINGKQCTAVELKLGTSIATSGKYCKRYLSKPYTGHGKIFKGNMIPILARISEEEIENIALKERDIAVNEKWILIVRDNDIQGKLTGKTSLKGENLKKWECMKASCSIISLEELLKEIPRPIIDGIIKNCITPTDGDEYLKNWKLIS